jgi:hypothetical protein
VKDGKNSVDYNVHDMRYSLHGLDDKDDDVLFLRQQRLRPALPVFEEVR